MTESSNAVFLSYASQDAAAAARICEALSAAGIEVWFDQSELRGGDAWDRQIKKQIHECALFVPIISANSQARLEGYFRLEWRLAVERTHLMADRKTFLVPVIIDNTKDKEAEVPDSFRAMQWTRLPGGETPAEFCERVRVLLGVAETLSQSQAAGRQRRPVTPTRNSNRWSTVVAAGLLMAGVIGWQAWRMVQPKASSASAPTAVATAPEKSIAVLPFADMSEKHDQEYFADGMAEEILDLLSRTPELRVPARTSSFYFKGKSEDIPTIAHRLMVANVLEGSVRKSGNQVRVTVQLVRADNGYHLWSETFDRTINDLFKVQDEIAGEVVKALKISIDNDLAPRAVPTSSAEAHRLLLQAQFWDHRGTREGWTKAVGYYQQAIKEDPNFAEAWAGLSGAQVGLSGALVYANTSGQEWHRTLELALPAAERAVALNSNLAMAHFALAEVRYWLDWDWVAANTEYQKALSLDPDNSHALDGAGRIAAIHGRVPVALRLWQQAADRDPLNYFPYANLAYMYYFMGKFPDALAAMRKCADLAPTAEGMHGLLAQMLMGAGLKDQALAEAQKEPNGGFRDYVLAWTYIKRGENGAADAAIARAEWSGAQDQPYNIAQLHALRGQRDQAFAWLDRAYQEHDSTIIGTPSVTVDRDIKNLYGDPRWSAFLSKMHLPE